MSSRLRYTHFQKLDKGVFTKAINDKIFEEVKKFNPKFTKAKQLTDYIDKLNSDLRSFASYY